MEQLRNGADTIYNAAEITFLLNENGLALDKIALVHVTESTPACPAVPSQWNSFWIIDPWEYMVDRSAKKSVADLYGTPETFLICPYVSSGELVPLEDNTRTFTPEFMTENIFGATDDGSGEGLVAEVFELGSALPALPDFDTLGDPDATLLMPQVNIGSQNLTQGFPHNRRLNSNCGLKIRGRLQIAADCTCLFRLSSDDGSRLTIAGTQVVDNDGLHGFQAVEGTVELTAGTHDLALDYYQGGGALGVRLEIDPTGVGDAFQVIPAADFLPPQ